MATSSIFTNIVIRDSKEAEALADALEASRCDLERESYTTKIPVLHDVEEIRKFLSKEGQKL